MLAAAKDTATKRLLTMYFELLKKKSPNEEEEEVTEWTREDLRFLSEQAIEMSAAKDTAKQRLMTMIFRISDRFENINLLPDF